MSADTLSSMPDLLRTIWTRPRTTMRWVLDHGDGGLWRGLLATAAASLLVPVVLPAFLLAPRLAELRFLGSVVLSAGLALALVGLVFVGALVLLGRAFAGRRPVGDVLRALGWGLVPVAAALPFVVLGVIGMFRGLPGLVPVGQAIAAVTGAWSFVLLASTVSEAHDVPLERGIGVLLGAATIVLVLVLAVLYAVVSVLPGKPH